MTDGQGTEEDQAPKQTADENVPNPTNSVADVTSDADDGTKWAAEATKNSERLASKVSNLETSLQRGLSAANFRPFWDEARALHEELRMAKPIALDDKLGLQRQVGALCESARVAQSEQRTMADGFRTELESSLQLALETLADARSAADIQQVRADLTVIRERLDSSGTTLGRGGRQSLWEAWQRVNQSAWQALTDRWELGAQSLEILLNQADEDVQNDRPRDARERIKQFRTAIASNELSRPRLRKLSNRAESIWKRASELSREKHKQYLRHTGRRVESWRGALQRTHRVRDELTREIENARRQAAEATTDVGAALLRGHTAERERELQKLEAEIRELEGRILRAEDALSRP